LTKKEVVEKSLSQSNTLTHKNSVDMAAKTLCIPIGGIALLGQQD